MVRDFVRHGLLAAILAAAFAVMADLLEPNQVARLFGCLGQVFFSL